VPSGAINRLAARRAPAATTRSTTLPVPASFSFLRTVQSHGWFDLPPFYWDAQRARLTRTLSLPAAGPAAAHVTFAPAARGAAARLVVSLEAARPIVRSDTAAARRMLAHVFRLDEDLDSFYRSAGLVERPDLRWTAQRGAGRLLRSPDVYEDLVKMICTTNCTWALTRVMVSALVDRLGGDDTRGVRLFPDAETMAGRTPRFYRDVVRAGYRGVFLRSLARRVARGDLDLAAWNDPRRPTADIREEILSVDGAGRYVADNMLKLLGRYDGLGIDSWCRRKFSEMYHKGRAVGDLRIARFYEPFGAWRGLALWCDITQDWFDGDKPLLPLGETPGGTDKFPGAGG